MKKIIQLLIFSYSLVFPQNGIISGFISDSSSGEALIGANVIIKETSQGMATDINGYYIIQNINPLKKVLKNFMKEIKMYFLLNLNL